MSPRHKQSPAARFAKHTLLMSAMFVLAGLAAFALALFVKAGERAGAPVPLVCILTVLEYAMLIIDSLVLLYWFAKSAWIFLKEIER